MEYKKYKYIYQSAFFQKSFIIFFVLLISFFMVSHQVFANANIDGSFGIANYIPISGSVTDGDIVSFAPSSGYFLSKTQYDSAVIGVVITNPAISLETNTGKRTYPVISSGNAPINVTTINGNIKKGDPITTSKIPGEGMKATQTGYVIGAALEDYANNNKTAVKQIAVSLNVHYYTAQGSLGNSLLDVFNLTTLATYEEPLKVFKYFVAALTLVLSFVFGFFSFARTANKGLEALGRNPLASRMIELGILLNIIVAIIIVLSGLLVAFFVIRL